MSADTKKRDRKYYPVATSVGRKRKPIAVSGWRMMLFLACVCMLSSCFTGVEYTRPIAPARGEREILQPQAEDTVLVSLPTVMLGQWEVGRPFVVADDRISHILEADSRPDIKVSDTVRYVGLDTRMQPDATSASILLFEKDGRRFRYPLGALMHISADTLSNRRIPMLIDLAMVQRADEVLRGKTLWLRSSLRYDSEGKQMKGLKYIPVTVTSVTPGALDFPLQVNVTDEAGGAYHLKMNSGTGLYESRTFTDLFTLFDPRTRYNAIPDSTWQRIQRGDVALGMTKDECRLALGNPDDADAGHTHSQTLDLWQYASGITLRFADGVLVKFRK